MRRGLDLNKNIIQLHSRGGKNKSGSAPLNETLLIYENTNTPLSNSLLHHHFYLCEEFSLVQADRVDHQYWMIALLLVRVAKTVIPE